MAAPFRIAQHTRLDDSNGLQAYLERLIKMIPGEIVGLYLIGAGFIPAAEAPGSAIWFIVCLILLIIIRVYGTADPQHDKPYQPVPVAVACVAFVIWVYSLGGPFAKYGIDVPWIGSLMVLVWSFLIPIFFKGPDE